MNVIELGDGREGDGEPKARDFDTDHEEQHTVGGAFFWFIAASKGTIAVTIKRYVREIDGHNQFGVFWEGDLF